MEASSKTETMEAIHTEKKEELVNKTEANVEKIEEQEDKERSPVKGAKDESESMEGDAHEDDKEEEQHEEGKNEGDNKKKSASSSRSRHRGRRRHNTKKAAPATAVTTTAAASTDAPAANANSTRRSRSRQQPSNQSQQQQDQHKATNKQASSKNSPQSSPKPPHKQHHTQPAHHHRRNANKPRSHTQSNKATHATTAKQHSQQHSSRSHKNTPQAPQQHYKQPTLPTLSPEQLAQNTIAAASQVEYFFTANELCRNTFVRQHMDLEGYIPAAIIFNFPSVAAYAVPYQDLMLQLTKSQFLDCDTVNETLRLKDGWKKWLYPNEDGTFGCVKWVKQQNAFQADAAAATDTADAATDTATNKPTTAKHDDPTASSTPELVHCTDSDSENTEPCS